MEYISFFEYLKSEQTINDVFRRICEFDSKLMEIHKNGYCVDNLDFDKMYLVSDGDSLSPVFSNAFKSSEQEIKNQNIKDLAYLSLGIFVSLKMGGGLVYDYAKICRSNPDFVVNNYLTISDVILDFNGISECKTFYDEIINGKFGYLTNYITNKNNKNNENRGKANNGAVLSYYTPAGKAFSQDSDAAFVNAMFYPIVIICVIAIVIMIYLLYKYL